jgi:hypothetical protein
LPRPLPGGGARSIAAAALLLLACGPQAPLSLTITEYDPLSASARPLVEGDVLHLQLPPQGGLVVFIGARLAGDGTPQITLRGRLLGADGQLIGEDSRTTRFVAADDDPTVAVPSPASIAAMANVPVCPGSNGRFSPDDIVTLEVTATEVGSGRTGRAQRMVRPGCHQNDPVVRSLCACECGPSFLPGHCSMRAQGGGAMAQDQFGEAAKRLLDTLAGLGARLVEGPARLRQRGPFGDLDPPRRL